MPKQLVCPRCRYDVSGDAARWNRDDSDGCPLEGTCPECGMRFAWRSVYRPELASPRWFLEGPKGWRGRASFLRTMLRTLLPWRFWGPVSLETPHSWVRRSVWGVLALAAPPCLAFAGLNLYHALTAGSWLLSFKGGSISPPSWQAIQLVNSWQSFATGYAQVHGSLPWVIVTAVGLLMYPLILMLLPWTRQKAKLHTSHVVRASVYAAAPLVLMGVLSFLCLSLGYVLPLFAGGQAARLAANQEYLLHVDPARLVTRLNYANRWPHPHGYWIAMVLWFPLWWGCALARGFRVKEWPIVLLAMMVPAIILQCIALMTDFTFSFPRW